MNKTLPNIIDESLLPIDEKKLFCQFESEEKPKVLILYGSLRQRLLSRFAAEEAGRLLEWFGAEVKMFNPEGLPLPDTTEADHPKVKELRYLSTWSQAQVWCSPERHGSMTGIMKAQIDWLLWQWVVFVQHKEGRWH